MITHDAIYHDTIYIVRDTVVAASESVLRNIHEINATTAMHTDPKPWTWISVTIASIALLITFFTWLSQRRTEKNTFVQINPKIQENILLELIRHLYANMIVTVTLNTLLEQCDFNKYPSEEHLLKLKMDPSFIHPELFSDSSGDRYSSLHRLIILFRNYNIEVETTLKHLKDESLNKDVKRRDIKTLLMKPGYLTNEIMRACKICFKSDTVSKARKKIHDDYEMRSSVVGHINIEGRPYYDNYENGFIRSLYSESYDEKMSFLEMLNENVAQELGKNQEKSSKVALIDFHEPTGHF